MKEIEQKIMAGMKLSDEEQLKMVKSGNKELIKRHLMSCKFCPEAETELVKLCDVELIELYLQRYQMNPEAYMAYESVKDKWKNRRRCFPVKRKVGVFCGRKKLDKLVKFVFIKPLKFIIIRNYGKDKTEN